MLYALYVIINPIPCWDFYEDTTNYLLWKLVVLPSFLLQTLDYNWLEFILELLG